MPREVQPCLTLPDKTLSCGDTPHHHLCIQALSDGNTSLSCRTAALSCCPVPEQGGGPVSINAALDFPRQRSHGAVLLWESSKPTWAGLGPEGPAHGPTEMSTQGSHKCSCEQHVKPQGAKCDQGQAPRQDEGYPEVTAAKYCRVHPNLSQDRTGGTGEETQGGLQCSTLCHAAPCAAVAAGCSKPLD